MTASSLFSDLYLGNIITPPSAAAALGYEQMDYFVPIKVREQPE